jgi:hypothetical protein
VFDQTAHFNIVNQQNVIMRFEIKGCDTKEKTNFQSLNRLLKRVERDNLKKSSEHVKDTEFLRAVSFEHPLDTVLSNCDLIFLSRKLSFLNFMADDINQIKMRLRRDFYYLCRNNITNFTLQVIVEQNKQGTKQN